MRAIDRAMHRAALVLFSESSLVRFPFFTRQRAGSFQRTGRNYRFAGKTCERLFGQSSLVKTAFPPVRGTGIQSKGSMHRRTRRRSLLSPIPNFPVTLSPFSPPPLHPPFLRLLCLSLPLGCVPPGEKCAEGFSSTNGSGGLVSGRSRGHTVSVVLE